MGFFRRKQNTPQPTRDEALRCIPVISPQVQWQLQVDGEIFIEYPLATRPLFLQIARRFHPQTDAKTLTRKLQLDHLGSAVWQLLDGKRSVAEIIQKFANQQKVSLRDAEHSITLFLRDLGKRGLVLLRESHQKHL